MDNRFPKCRVFDITFHSSPLNAFFRKANCACLHVWRFEFSWRMPWSPDAAYAKGWDSAWRQFYTGRVADDALSAEKAFYAGYAAGNPKGLLGGAIQDYHAWLDTCTADDSGHDHE